VDLQLTRRGDYALRAAVSLARHTAGGEYRKLREIAEEMAIPARYSHEIVSLLVKAGLVEAMAGKNGGYRLVRSPEDISLLDIIEAGDGALRLDRCALDGGPCSNQETICAAHPMLESGVKAMTAAMRTRSLADVLQQDRKLKSRSKTARGVA
jgi:Rrf2 family protein